MTQLPRMIAVVGTNASGKSGLGVLLAQRFGGEVISADSRQVYTGLDLGSGKLTPQEMGGVPHHLIDVCEPGVFFSMADFQRLAYAAAEDILARGKVPFLVGGTGLYIDAVADGYVLSDIQPDLAYRSTLEALPTEALVQRLDGALPGHGIDPANRNRVMRALEKLHDGDTAAPRKQPRYQVLKLGLTWPREVLCRRIDERLAARVADGLIDEVAGLLQRGVSPDFLRRLGLEYRYVSEYLLGQYPAQEVMLAELALAIKRFAKRQMTWFRRDAGIQWLDVTGDVAAQAADAVAAFLRG